MNSITNYKYKFIDSKLFSFFQRLLILSLLLLPLITYHLPLSFAANLPVNTVMPRIVTPNGDGINDLAFFCYENPTDLPASGAIYDMKSMKVADVRRSNLFIPNATVLTWDGKDSNANVVEAGIYIYKIEIGNQAHTGSVVVAR